MREIQPEAEVAFGFGEEGYWYGRAYGAHTRAGEQDSSWGIDAEVAHSQSDGPIDNGDHDFDRVSLRFQRSDGHSQTDLFFGFQDKFFGWPNLYTPFGVPETEDLQTQLWFLNHRYEEGDFFWQGSAYFRRHKDDYEFDRTDPGVFNPFEHTTEVWNTAMEAGWSANDWSWMARMEWLQDDLESTSLTFGEFSSRNYLKLGLLASTEWEASNQGTWSFTSGLTFDDHNRGSSELSPLVRLSLDGISSKGQSWQIYADVSRNSQVPGYTAIASNPSGGLFRGNPNLSREIATNFEVGYGTQWGDLQFQAAAFLRKDRDLVDWTFAYDVFGRTANNVDIDTSGLEFLLSYALEGGRVVVGYTALSKDEDYGLATVDASFYALNFARHRATLAFIYELGAGWELRSDTVFRIQHENILRTAGTPEDAILSSLGLFYFPQSLEGLELSIAVVNLWDSDFEEIPSVPASPRQISFNTVYRW